MTLYTSTVYTDTNCAEFDARLSYREQSNATGNLEICLNNTWNSVANCFGDNIQDIQDVIEVACRSLGFNDFDGTNLSPAIIPALPTTIAEAPLATSLSCSGSETHLSECEENQQDEERICSALPIRIECLGKYYYGYCIYLV